MSGLVAAAAVAPTATAARGRARRAATVASPAALTTTALSFFMDFLGNGRNLKTLAKNVVALEQKQQEQPTVFNTTSGILIDLRGHGKSKHLAGATTTDEESMLFDACVQDVHRTLFQQQQHDGRMRNNNEQHQDVDANITTTDITPTTTTTTSSSIVPPSRSPNVVSSVMGHSWGGRIALQYVHSLLENNNINNTDDDSLLPTLWLLDTVPGQAHDSVLDVLNVIQSIDLQRWKTRRDIAGQLQNHGMETSMAQWLASNTYKDSSTQQLQWNFDVDMVQSMLPEFQTQDFVGMVRDIVINGNGRGTVHLIKGGRNPAWSADGQTALSSSSPSRMIRQLDELEQEYPHQFQQHVLPKAGHWVHVDDLPGLLEIIKQQ